MTKREAKIEALEIAIGLCTDCDLMMWDEGGNVDNQQKILGELNLIALALKKQHDKLKGES